MTLFDSEMVSKLNNLELDTLHHLVTAEMQNRKLHEISKILDDVKSAQSSPENIQTIDEAYEKIKMLLEFME